MQLGILCHDGDPPSFTVRENVIIIQWCCAQGSGITGIITMTKDTSC